MIRNLILWYIGTINFAAISSFPLLNTSKWDSDLINQWNEQSDAPTFHILLHFTSTEQHHSHFTKIMNQFHQIPPHLATSKVHHIRHHLISHAHQTQQSIHQFLTWNCSNESSSRRLTSASSHYHSFRSLWITNQLSISHASRNLIIQLSMFSSIYQISLDHQISKEDMNQYVLGQIQSNDFSTSSKAQFHSIDGNLDHLSEYLYSHHITNLLEARTKYGIYGKNTRIGVIDSGLYYQHELFQHVNVIAWKDTVLQRSEPYDDRFHGTHISGILVGKAPIGVAPQADLVICKGIDQNGIFNSNIKQCIEFMLCPDPSNCENTKPHVINNSWNLFTQFDTSFDTALHIWKEAGIIPVFSVGNKFNPFSCVDLKSLPPSTSANVIAVGASTEKNELAKFSRHGEFPFDDKDPTIVAPGQSILSASNLEFNGYMLQRGTSMASPYVTATIALMIELARNLNKTLTFEMIRSILISTAMKSNVSPNPEFPCGFDNKFPNPLFGGGILNVLHALEAVEAL